MTCNRNVRLSFAAMVLLAEVAGAGFAGAQGNGAPGHETVPVPSESDATRPDKPDVVVTAPKLPDDAAVRILTRRITSDITRSEPLARFADPVCFGISGLPRKLAMSFSNRLVFNAQQAGVRLAGERCKPNVVVMFVDDGKATLSQLLKKHSWLFKDMESWPVRHLIREPGPVYAWGVSEVRSADGNRTHYEPAFGDKPVLNVSFASITVLPVRRDLRRSVMLIDRHAALGLTLTQIADYAAFRTLAMVRPKGKIGSDTILTLFEQRAERAPDQMTPFDRGYLKALYAGKGNQRSTIEVGYIARKIIRNAEDAEVHRVSDAVPRSAQ